MTASDFTVLDLFSGAGGLTEGFFRNGFRFANHIEVNADAVKTLETRSLYHSLLEKNRKDVYFEYYTQNITREEFISQCTNLNAVDKGITNQEINADTEEEIIRNIKNRMEQQKIKEIDVIIGGPPCQAYSLIGRGRDPNRMHADPRNLLYLHYLKFIREFKPDIFLFENVPGLISAKNGQIYHDFLGKIKQLGYTTTEVPPILNSADFGVLQDRKRIIFIGWKKENRFEYPVFTPLKNNFRIWNLLNDLHELEPGEGTDGIQTYKRGRPSHYLRDFNMRNGFRCIRHHEARTHNERDREIYRIAINKWNDEQKRLKYPELPQELRTHTNQTSFYDRFKVVNGDGFSHAVVAHISKDGHYFIHPDINQARSITVREAARIQSFPDDFLFEGSRTSKYIQIGNAVPPLMAKGIAREIKSMLSNN